MQVDINKGRMSLSSGSKKNSHGRFFLIFGGIWLLFSIPFGLAGYFMLQNEKIYENNSQIIQGKLLSKYITEERKSGKKQSSKTYRLNYNFINEQGDEVKGKDSVDKTFWENLQEGQNLPIQIIPGQSADKNRVPYEGRSDSLAAYIFMGFSVLMFVLGTCFLVPYFRKRSIYKRLAREGISVEAEITGVGPGNLTINKVRQWLVRYSYKDYQGKMHEGKSDHLNPAQAQHWTRGDKTKVKYDKLKPSVSIWLE